MDGIEILIRGERKCYLFKIVRLRNVMWRLGWTLMQEKNEQGKIMLLIWVSASLSAAPSAIALSKMFNAYIMINMMWFPVPPLSPSISLWLDVKNRLKRNSLCGCYVIVNSNISLSLQTPQVLSDYSTVTNNSNSTGFLFFIFNFF